MTMTNGRIIEHIGAGIRRSPTINEAGARRMEGVGVLILARRKQRIAEDAEHDNGHLAGQRSIPIMMVRSLAMNVRPRQVI